MPEPKICGYTRISVDLNEDSDVNTSIETQKKRIINYIKMNYPNVEFNPEKDIFVDRDRSGYTFDKREGYQRMKAAIAAGKYNTLIVKDMSRFGRRVSEGAHELESFIDAGVQVIGCDDGSAIDGHIDMLTYLRMIISEDYVTGTSKKVSAAIETRQKEGTWICNAPYGYYIRPDKKGQIFVDEEGKEAVQKIFELYIQGHGYKSISHYMTEHGYPTGRALMLKQLEDRGGDTSKMLKQGINPVWSAVSIAKIVTNDFYIGTLRQGVWKKAGLTKQMKRTDMKEHYVFPNHHEAMIDMDTWEKAQRQYRKSTRHNYSGTSLHKNPYTGIIRCADCGSPMFAVGGTKYRRGYNCGNYLKNGIKGQNENRKRKRKSDYTDLGCTASHYIAEEVLDDCVKTYITKVRDRLSKTLAELDVEKSQQAAQADRESVYQLQQEITELRNEISQYERQRVRQIARDEAHEQEINQRFDTLVDEVQAEIHKLELKVAYLSEQSAKKKELKQSYEEVILQFGKLLKKDGFEKTDLNTIIEEISVDDEKVVVIKLYSDITELFDLAQ